jgi:hypothetical protein
LCGRPDAACSQDGFAFAIIVVNALSNGRQLVDNIVGHPKNRHVTIIVDKPAPHLRRNGVLFVLPFGVQLALLDH